MPLQPGQILNNRYRIDRLLGQGGFGAVYLAWDLNLDAQVAIKESLEVSPASDKQFRSEAKLLFKLHNTNLPRVHDCFSIPDQGLYLTMDYIEGESLESKLARQGGPLPFEQVLAWIGPICDALDYLHHQSPPVIHRDIKPANIIVRQDGCPFLVDFGISKIFDRERKTTIGARAYTPGYSPPEQYGLAPTDARSDIYALGATVYHLLAGKAPPPSIDVPSGVMPPSAPLHMLNPAVPPHAGQAVMKAMQLNRMQRWNSAGEFKQALSGAPAERVVQRVQPSVQAQPGGVARTQVAPVIPRTERAVPVTDHGRPNRLWIPALLLALGGLVVLALVIGGLIGLQAVRQAHSTETAAAAQIDAAATRTTEVTIPTTMPSATPSANWMATAPATTPPAHTAPPSATFPPLPSFTPSPWFTATPSLPPAVIEPYCSMFDQSPQYVQIGQPVVLWWRWDASTRAQVEDHIAAASYEIYLDGVRIEADRMSEIEFLSDEQFYRVSWYATVGVLSPGKHFTERFLSWARKITDGWETFGPGGKTETESHNCEIIVR